MSNRIDYTESSEDLPVCSLKNELIDAVKAFSILLVVGETGSGKTTKIPQYLLEAFPESKIAVTQPRRIAATTNAKRVSDLVGSRLGDKVGYAIRFEDCRCERTKLTYMTDGILLRQLMGKDSDSIEPDGPQKDHFNHLYIPYDIIILDEAHERSIEGDLLFGLVKGLVLHRSGPESAIKPLKVIIMSATLEVEKLSDYFGQCPVFNIPGRTFPVHILHQSEVIEDKDTPGKVVKKAPKTMTSLVHTYVPRAIQTVMHIHEKEDKGDVLVFLTGFWDIESAMQRLQEAVFEEGGTVDSHQPNLLWFKGGYIHESRSPHLDGILLCPIYGSMESLEQRAIFYPPPKGVRKVVFATNIAQTSITVPGVRFVVDGGFEKQKMYDPKTGMDALLVVPVSQSAATQRAGRAGRTQDGKAYRLYTRQQFIGLSIHTTPEIQRSTLITTVLHLKKLGLPNILEFDFVDRPDPHLIKTAIKQLFALQALDEDGHLTEMGKILSQFPISPFLGRALIASAGDLAKNVDPRELCSVEVLKIVAMLSVEDIFVQIRGGPTRDTTSFTSAIKKREKIYSQYMDPTGDHISLLLIYDDFKRVLSSSQGDMEYVKKWCRRHFFHFRALCTADRVREQMEELMRQVGLSIVSGAQKRKRQQMEHEPSEDYCEWNTNAILKAFSKAFYPHTAKKHMTKPFFYNYMASTSSTSIWSFQKDSDRTEESVVSGLTSDNRLFAMYLSPLSAFISRAAYQSSDWSDELDWVMYHEVTYTQKATMRVVSKIEFSWVEPYLRRLQNIDEARLLGQEKESPISADVSLESNTQASFERPQPPMNAQREKGESETCAKKNTLEEDVTRQDMVEAARQRYLARQKKH